MQHAKKILFLLTFLILETGTDMLAQAPGGLKVLNYNVLHGFNNDSVLIKKYVNWVVKVNPDIVTYQELNGFDQEKLENLAKRYGHPYAAINTGVTHPIGISSRYPIVMVHKVVDNMWHSYLYGNIEGLHVFVTHLSPFDVESRRNDIKLLLAHTRLIPKNEKIMIAGDLNSLSVADSANYGPGLLQSMLKSEGRLEPKSGLPIVRGKTIYRHNLNNGKIDFTVTNLIADAGFVDAVPHINKSFMPSVPTKKFAKAKSYYRRIDYVWVNPVLAGYLKHAEIIRDNETGELSDHYPVLVKFEFN